MKPRDMAAPYLPRNADVDGPRYKQRQPDKGLLEHERKREVEVKVFELRDKLEEDGYVFFFTYYYLTPFLFSSWAHLQKTTKDTHISLTQPHPESKKKKSKPAAPPSEKPSSPRWSHQTQTAATPTTGGGG